MGVCAVIKVVQVSSSCCAYTLYLLFEHSISWFDHEILPRPQEVERKDDVNETQEADAIGTGEKDDRQGDPKSVAVYQCL